MDFDDDDRDDEMELEMEMPPAAPAYNPLAPTSRQKMGEASSEGNVSSARKRAPTTAATANTTLSAVMRYRECLKNHAIGVGGHAVDGCCEFLAAGEEGTIDALKCAACNCHRNFHRKEPDGELIHHHQGGPGPYHQPQHLVLQHQFSSGYYRPPPPPSGYLITSPHGRSSLALAAVSGGGGGSQDGEELSNPSSSGGAGGGFGGSKKRHRTKFTQEQKEKMLEFAEKVGWRIQKHDEPAVEGFCSETGVKRHVLKVWMHNNKHTLGGKKLVYD